MSHSALKLERGDQRVGLISGRYVKQSNTLPLLVSGHVHAVLCEALTNTAGCGRSPTIPVQTPAARRDRGQRASRRVSKALRRGCLGPSLVGRGIPQGEALHRANPSGPHLTS